MKWLKRFFSAQESDDTFEVVAADQKTMQEAVDEIQSVHGVTKRIESDPHVVDLEGSRWLAYGQNGVVYLTGADGEIQAQFEPMVGTRLAGLIAEASLEAV